LKKGLPLSGLSACGDFGVALRLSPFEDLSRFSRDKSPKAEGKVIKDRKSARKEASNPSKPCISNELDEKNISILDGKLLLPFEDKSVAY
jgi:hypothetical protein